MPYITLLFDLDGTLVDSVADLATAVNLLRDELALPPLPLATVRQNVGDGARELVRRSLPPVAFAEERLQRFLVLYGEHLADQTVVYPGIRELLASYPPASLAVVTNKPLGLTLRLLERLDLKSRFSAVVGGDSVPVKKPSPVPVQLALHRLGRPAAGALMIGDHHTDLRAGQGAGVATCFCTWGLGHDDGLIPDLRATTVAELVALLT
jgi:phosphoglycolate phosphatase